MFGSIPIPTSSASRLPVPLKHHCHSGRYFRRYRLWRQCEGGHHHQRTCRDVATCRKVSEDPVTVSGLAGIGDLVVTCLSRHSRNRYVGEEIGRGRSLDDVVAHMNMVAEGVFTSKAVYDLSRTKGVEMPITQAVYEMLFEGKPVQQAILDLMTREPKRKCTEPLNPLFVFFGYSYHTSFPERSQASFHEQLSISIRTTRR